MTNELVIQLYTMCVQSMYVVLMNIPYYSPLTYLHTVPQPAYIPASIVVIVGGFVATDSPGTPSLRAATNREYVVPCCRLDNVCICGELEGKTVMLLVPSL